MKTAAIIGLVSILLIQTPAAHAQVGENQMAQSESYDIYFRCLRVYANRYIKTEALAADVAAAAMSACENQYQALFTATTRMFGGYQQAEAVLKDARDNARNFTVRTVLEARMLQK
jgi:hypothetical protein